MEKERGTSPEDVNDVDIKLEIDDGNLEERDGKAKTRAVTGSTSSAIKPKETLVILQKRSDEASPAKKRIIVMVPAGTAPSSTSDSLTSTGAAEPVELRHRCSECSFQSSFRREFLTHYEAEHLKTRTYRCELCTGPKALAFTSIDERNQHLQEIHKACKICEYEGSEMSDLRDHITSLHSANRYKHNCTHCGVSCSTHNALDEHVQSRHMGTLLRCKVCDFKTNDSYSLCEHLSSVHESKALKCGSCEFETDIPWKMADHMKTHSVAGYACNLCDYKTNRIMFLKRHKKARHSPKHYACPKCSYRSAQRWCIKQHIAQVHEKSKYYCCNFCSYKACSRGNLNLHIRRVHYADNRYKCRVCSFKTFLKSDFAKHLLAHGSSKIMDTKSTN